MIDAAARIVFTSALVYSHQFPFSTCVILDAGRIAWIGDDAGLAGQLIESDIHIPCDGALIAPSFFDAHMSDPNAVDPSIAAGYVAILGQMKLIQLDSERQWVDAVVTGSGQLERVELDDATLTPEAIESLLAERKFAVVPPSIAASSLNALARAGVPFAFGSFGALHSPWEWMQAAVYGTSNGLSARAAFNAATRSGWRLAGAPDTGTLSVGESPSMCLWRCAHVQVQVPDARVRAWSTDVRAGTPPLPDLSPGARLPELMGTVIGGDYRAAA